MTSQWPNVTPLSITLHCDGDAIELTGSMTLGRHLDNDIIVAGEDVLDYHARIEVTERGVTLHPLLDATITHNSRAYAKPITLTPYDKVELGQTQLSFSASLNTPGSGQWDIVSTQGDRVALKDQLLLGRADDADVVINDDHISRHHARLTLADGVWLQDLGSANGTFVNGERIRGGVRLLHGDVISLDAHRLQLRNDASELTPLKPLNNTTNAAYIRHSENPANAQSSPVDAEATVVGVAQPLAAADTAQATALGRPPSGPHLLGVSDSIAGLVYPTPMGSLLVGRDVSCDIVLDHPSVSARHAELTNRAEGCSITNLIATNGTRVNDIQVTTQRLAHGDRLTLGQLQLRFNHAVPEPTKSNAKQQVIILVASLVIAALLTWWW